MTVLSGEAINTAPFWWHSFVPGVSPVLHLINQPKATRQAVGSALLTKLCTAPGADGADDFADDEEEDEYMTVNWEWSWEWLATEYVASLEAVAGAFGASEEREAVIQVTSDDTHHNRGSHSGFCVRARAALGRRFTATTSH